MRTLILGLGNPILRDDAVGLRVVQTLRVLLPDRQDVDVEEDYHGGLRLMERLVGYDHAIIIDAIQTGAPAGTIHTLTPSGRPTQRSASPHDVDLPTALALGRQSGAHLPADKDILIIGVEAAEVLDFGETLTPAVEAAIPALIEAVLGLLKRKEGPWSVQDE